MLWCCMKVRRDSVVIPRPKENLNLNVNVNVTSDDWRESELTEHSFGSFGSFFSGETKDATHSGQLAPHPS